MTRSYTTAWWHSVHNICIFRSHTRSGNSNALTRLFSRRGAHGRRTRNSRLLPARAKHRNQRAAFARKAAGRLAGRRLFIGFPTSRECGRISIRLTHPVCLPPARSHRVTAAGNFVIFFTLVFGPIKALPPAFVTLNGRFCSALPTAERRGRTPARHTSPRVGTTSVSHVGETSGRKLFQINFTETLRDARVRLMSLVNTHVPRAFLQRNTREVYARYTV